jgi:hypothetical protein
MKLVQLLIHVDKRMSCRQRCAPCSCTTLCSLVVAVKRTACVKAVDTCAARLIDEIRAESAGRGLASDCREEKEREITVYRTV